VNNKRPSILANKIGVINDNYNLDDHNKSINEDNNKLKLNILNQSKINNVSNINTNLIKENDH